MKKKKRKKGKIVQNEEKKIFLGRDLQKSFKFVGIFGAQKKTEDGNTNNLVFAPNPGK